MHVIILFVTKSSEPVGGFSPNLHRLIVGSVERVNKILVTLTLFSRSHKGFEMPTFDQNRVIIYDIS